MDDIYRPITDAEPAEPATTSLAIESWGKFKDDLEKAADISHDDLTVEAATEERVRRRQQEPTPENANVRPIVVHKSKEDTGPQSLREAVDNLAYSRGLAMREELLAFSSLAPRSLSRQGAETHSIRRRSRSRSPTSPARKTTRSPSKRRRVG
jgi:hypothetical protein